MNQTEGYSQEQGASDELALGKITLSGVSGVALDVGGQLISNVGAPVNATDAARKTDVDAAQTAAQSYADGIVATERDARIAADDALDDRIDTEQQARIDADAALQTAIDDEEARALLAEGTLQTNIDNEASARQDADGVLQDNIDAEALARQNADTVLQGNIDDEAQARIDGDAAVTLAFEAADDLLEIDYIARDVVVLDSAKAYADSIQSGFIVKAPARAIAVSNITLSGTQTSDGVSLVAGDRILVAGQTDATKNGIYVVAAGAWARSADANTDAEVKAGMSVFIEEGTEYGDSTWVLVTDNPIVVGTTALSFVQFSGLGQIIAGEGLSKTGNTLNVEVGSGIAISADAVAVDLSATPGLQFESGKLAAKPDAARGLDKDASGLFVKHDGAKALAMDASSGLQVVVDSSTALKIDASAGIQNVLDTQTMAFRNIGGGVMGLGVNYDANRGIHATDANGPYKLAANIGGGALSFHPTDGYIQVVADSTKGLTIDPNAGLQVNVDEQRGLAIDAAEGVFVDLATNPGLQFTAGKLDMKLASANTLSKDASGLTVTGVPSLFKVNGVATSANVTAANLGTLTAGASSPADALHNHASVRGALLAAGSISAGKALYISANGTVSSASCSATSTARVVGVAVGASALGSVQVATYGACAAFSGLTAGTPYYLGADGSPVEFSALGSGDRVVRLGFGLTATSMMVEIQDMGAKA